MVRLIDWQGAVYNAKTKGFNSRDGAIDSMRKEAGYCHNCGFNSRDGAIDRYAWHGWRSAAWV